MEKSAKHKYKMRCLHQNKTLRFVAHQRPRLEDREKKKSIKLFLFYIFLNNTSYCSVSLYYKYIKISVKYKYIFFLVFRV